jgi:phospholipase/lecithinase/hemolysin
MRFYVSESLRNVLSARSFQAEEEEEMKNKRICYLFVLAFLLACLSPPAVSAEKFPKMYVFGDSLSDNGNLQSIRPDLFSPPRFDGRVTNGLVAIEQLAERLELKVQPSLFLLAMGEQGTNYAVAGAKAGGSDPIDLTAQVQAFLLNNRSAAPSEALYIVFIGGNDVAAARDEQSRAAARKTIRDAVRAIEANVVSLIEAGARDIMIVNGPDVGSVPQSISLSLSEQATRLSNEFNRLLARTISRVARNRSLDIVLFDLFVTGEQLGENFQALGFTNTNEPCFLTPIGQFNSVCGSPKAPLFDEFVWFDEFHPTARVHDRIGRALFAFVPIPHIEKASDQ